MKFYLLFQPPPVHLMTGLYPLHALLPGSRNARSSETSGWNRCAELYFNKLICQMYDASFALNRYISVSEFIKQTFNRRENPQDSDRQFRRC